MKCLKKKTKKDFLLLATKLIEKLADSSNAKEYYNSDLKKKNAKLEKQSKIITQQLKDLENPKHCSHKISYYGASINFT